MHDSIYERCFLETTEPKTKELGQITDSGLLPYPTVASPWKHYCPYHSGICPHMCILPPAAAPLWSSPDHTLWSQHCPKRCLPPSKGINGWSSTLIQLIKTAKAAQSSPSSFPQAWGSVLLEENLPKFQLSWFFPWLSVLSGVLVFSSTFGDTVQTHRPVTMGTCSVTYRQGNVVSENE